MPRPAAGLTAACVLALALSPPSGCACGPSECASPDGVAVDVPEARLGDEPLSVVTINLLHGWSDQRNDATLDDRLEVVAAALAELRPHVVLVQEASVTPSDRHCNVVATLRARLAATSGELWGSAHAPRNGADLVSFVEGPGLLARIAFGDVEVLEFEAQQAFERRVAVLAAVEGGPHVVSAHLAHHDDELRDGTLIRVLQARELAGRVAALAPGGALPPAVLGGDLNDVPGSETLDALLDAGSVDLWTQGAPLEAEGGTELVGAVDDPGASYARRIDHLLGFGGVAATGCARVLDAPVDAGGVLLWPSDHAGVSCTVALPDTETH
ncbi:MAG: endonuclease/exonuclease/phosphatase family protein [Deltaproteobacteria bacterium]|nr:endonuclease/exonuclease/phosphatase family protein [Deltaproteobacteria bacterium]